MSKGVVVFALSIVCLIPAGTSGAGIRLPQQ